MQLFSGMPEREPLVDMFNFSIQIIHNFPHASDGFQCSLVCLVLLSLLKHDQHTKTLIKDAAKLLVQDHL